jgi:hypothetical protein
MALIEPVTTGGILLQPQMKGTLSSSKALAISEALLGWLRTDCSISCTASGVSGYGAGICTGLFKLSVTSSTLSSVFASVGAKGQLGQILSSGVSKGVDSTVFNLLGTVVGVGNGSWIGVFNSVSGVGGLMLRLRTSYLGKGMTATDFELRSIATGVLSVMQSGAVTGGIIIGIPTVPVPVAVSGVPFTAKFI